MSVDFIGALSTAEVFAHLQELIAAYTTFSTQIPGLILSLDAVLDLLATLEGSIDFVLNASFGLTPLKLSAALEFQGALTAIADLTIAISNPLGQAIAAITAMAQATAQLRASLALGLPTVSAELTGQLTAVAAVAAAAEAKMLGIQAVIDAVLSALGPLVNARVEINNLRADLLATLQPLADIMGEFTLHMAGPGVYLYSGSTAYSDFEAVLGPPASGLLSTTTVNAVVLLVDAGTNPSTWADLQFLIRTTP